MITRRLEDLQEVEDGSEIAWTEGSSSGGDITEASASGDVELFSGLSPSVNMKLGTLFR